MVMWGSLAGSEEFDCFHLFYFFLMLVNSSTPEIATQNVAKKKKQVEED